MPVSVRAAASAATSAPAATPITLTIPKPAGTQPGDLLLAEIVYLRSGGSGISVCTPPSPDWRSVGKTAAADGIGHQGEVFMLPAGASEPASYDFVVSAGGAASMSAGGGILALVGVDLADPIHGIAGTAITGSTTAFTTPSLGTTFPDCLIVSIAASMAASRTFTAPAGTTERFDQATGTNVLGIAVGTDDAPAPIGATGTRAWVASAASRGLAQIVAVRPAPRGGATTTTTAVTIEATGRKIAAGSVEIVMSAGISAAGGKPIMPVVAQTDDVTVRMLALDGTWATCGVDTAVGVVPESVELHADRRGPSAASFDLRRRPDAIWPDLAAWAPTIVEIGGIPRWRGLGSETPIRDAGAETVISVQCRGRQFDLDADVLRLDLVHTRLSDWRDVRTWTETIIGANAACASGQVSSESGAIRLAYPINTAMTVGSWVGVALDLGELVARRVVVEWESSNNTAAVSVTCRGGESPDQSIAWASGTRHDAFRFALNTGASGISSGTFDEPHRYVQLYIFNDAHTGATGGDIWLKIKAIRVFTNPALEAGGQSILKASTILNGALDRAVHDLSADRSRIAPSSFNIAEFAPRRFVTIGESANAANAWHNQILKVDLHDRLVFQPRPTAPEIEIGAWPGSTFTDGAANSGEDVVNRAIVEGQNHDGTPVVVDRSAAEALLQLRPTREVGAANPSMDVDASGWRPIFGGTVARDTSVYHSSPASLAISDIRGEGTLIGTFRRGVVYVVEVWVTSSSSFAASLGFSVEIGTPTDWSRTRTGPFVASTWTRVRLAWRPLADISTAKLSVYGNTGGAPIRVDDVAFFTSMPTLADRRGRREPKVIQPSFPLSTEAGQQLADTFLRGHATTPLRGEAVIGIGGARHVLGGHDEHPAGLLDRTGELLRFAHRIDPDAGAVTRTGEIAGVTYRHRDRASTVAIDDNRGNFDALVARLESIQGAG